MRSGDLGDDGADLLEIGALMRWVLALVLSASAASAECTSIDKQDAWSDASGLVHFRDTSLVFPLEKAKPAPIAQIQRCIREDMIISVLIPWDGG